MTVIAQSSMTYSSGERRFLASGFGLQHTKTVTLLMSDFTEATHFPDGYIPAGQFVTEGADPTYFAPGSGAAGAHAYCILTDTVVPAGVTHVAVGVMRRGDIIEAALPEAPSAGVKTVAEAAGFTFE